LRVASYFMIVRSETLKRYNLFNKISVIGEICVNQKTPAVNGGRLCMGSHARYIINYFRTGTVLLP
jgi:hypothetical protein